MFVLQPPPRQLVAVVSCHPVGAIGAMNTTQLWLPSCDLQDKPNLGGGWEEAKAGEEEQQAEVGASMNRAEAGACDCPAGQLGTCHALNTTPCYPPALYRMCLIWAADGRMRRKATGRRLPWSRCVCVVVCVPMQMCFPVCSVEQHYTAQHYPARSRLPVGQ